MRHTNEYRQRDETGKPENRRYYIHGQDDELMTDMLTLSIVEWGECKEGDGEDGPDGAENHKVKLAGGCVVVGNVEGEYKVNLVHDYVDADISH